MHWRDVILGRPIKMAKDRVPGGTLVKDVSSWGGSSSTLYCWCGGAYTEVVVSKVFESPHFLILLIGSILDLLDCLLLLVH